MNTRIIIKCGITLAILVVAGNETANANTLYESGDLGPTGVSWDNVFNQVVLAGNVNSASFVGARFELSNVSFVEQVGGHFVSNPASSSNEFFAAIVRLDGSDDEPDSTDLSSPDVLTTELFSVPSNSTLAFADIGETYEPGWYAAIFGSGLFDAQGEGGSLLNNTPQGDPKHLGFLQGSGWGNRQPELFFRVIGREVPEPSSALFVITVAVFTLSRPGAMRTRQRGHVEITPSLACPRERGHGARARPDK